MHNTMKSY